MTVYDIRNIYLRRVMIVLLLTFVVTPCVIGCFLLEVLVRFVALCREANDDVRELAKQVNAAWHDR